MRYAITWKITPEVMESIVDLWKKGGSHKSIAKELGLSDHCVRWNLRREGYHRTGGETLKLAMQTGRLSPLAGPAHYNWKGGRKIGSEGRIMVWVARDHPFYSMANSRGYVLEHRLVMAQYLGRPLTSNELVHHLNGVPSDNRQKNLSLTTRSKHTEEWWKRNRGINELQGQIETLKAYTVQLEVENILLRRELTEREELKCLDTQ